MLEKYINCRISQNCMNTAIIIGIGVAIAIGIYLLIRNNATPAEEYEREIEKILTSDEYKVKGKFE
jgi:hypothetical protein